jgi:hypothetical protein
MIMSIYHGELNVKKKGKRNSFLVKKNNFPILVSTQGG